MRQLLFAGAVWPNFVGLPLRRVPFGRAEVDPVTHPLRRLGKCLMMNFPVAVGELFRLSASVGRHRIKMRPPVFLARKEHRRRIRRPTGESIIHPAAVRFLSSHFRLERVRVHYHHLLLLPVRRGKQRQQSLGIGRPFRHAHEAFPGRTADLDYLGCTALRQHQKYPEIARFIACDGPRNIFRGYEASGKIRQRHLPGPLVRQAHETFPVRRPAILLKSCAFHIGRLPDLAIGQILHNDLPAAHRRQFGAIRRKLRSGLGHLCPGKTQRLTLAVRIHQIEIALVGECDSTAILRDIETC